MKKIILASFISFFSLSTPAAVGDLYYCEMTQAVELKEDRLIKYIPQKFKFRIVEDNLIEFGEDDNYSYGSFYFADVIRWPADDYDKLTATAVSAQCSIVDDYSV